MAAASPHLCRRCYLTCFLRRPLLALGRLNALCDSKALHFQRNPGSNANPEEESKRQKATKKKESGFVSNANPWRMDKYSVLGQAIKYLENLQERVRMLEERAAAAAPAHVVVEDEEESAEEQIGNSDEQRLPEIEARVSNNNILMKIQCEKRRGILVKLLGEVEKLNLLVVNASVAPFGSFALDVTIIAEIDEEFILPAQDIVAALRSALQATA
ncbi:hypothetical protein BUALT_Bualt04G0094200 [Buddleja alternifolia]|uniref:Plant bHLH transcription factor ACT-like domain-containing protein n=1 Tax=Buddleja alternifolia TaxID=168488 RepID=A0AAV6XMM0_9LAMI|nr:hypothetical protein BUALT_Bualt04G0094200 [Buddleja alternifolia]